MFNTNFRAALKVPSDDPRRLYLVSFNRMYDRQLGKQRRKPFPVIRQHD